MTETLETKIEYYTELNVEQKTKNTQNIRKKENKIEKEGIANANNKLKIS